MQLGDLMTPESILPLLRGADKRQLLQDLARHAARRVGLDEKTIFEGLAARERVDTTGIGGGTAVPHARLPGLTRIYVFFARLARPIPFDAVDDVPVDLVFLLLAPDDAGTDYLKTLARLTRLMRDRATCAKLRGTDDTDALYALLANRNTSDAA